MPAGTIISSGSLVSPSGKQGQIGVTGPTGLAGLPGPRAVSTDPGNITTLGSDSLVFVRPLAKTNRYIYQCHYDHPLAPSQVVSTFSGGSVTANQAGTANHPGVIAIKSGAATGSQAAISSGVKDIQRGFFQAIAFRCVFNYTAAGNNSANSNNYTVQIGFMPVTSNVAAPDGVFFEFNGLDVNNLTLIIQKGNSFGVTIGPTSNYVGWLDLQIYWTSAGSISARAGLYSPNSLPPLVPGSPFSNISPTVSQLWGVNVWNTSVCSTSYTGYLDLVEVVGDCSGLQYRGESLIDSF